MEPTPPDVTRAPAEAGSLAAEVARAYKDMATLYRDEMGLTGPEADARVLVAPT
jgi:hypothetical protein